MHWRLEVSARHFIDSLRAVERVQKSTLSDAEFRLFVQRYSAETGESISIKAAA